MGTSAQSSTSQLVEPLTRRERQILRLMGQGLTNPEIAQTITLALNSVKWYANQIYRKLGVNDRKQALARARELGLLEEIKPGAQATAAEKAARQSLPTGTVTFLFTDIQGSTPLWERHPEEMAEALQIHYAALRQAIEAHDGTVFKTVGDAFQAAFATAIQALRAAIEGQQALQAAPWNELGPLKVRMGLHTGEAELDPGGDEYAVSHTKNRAARIMSAAHGGQILLSEETTDLVRRRLPEGVTLKDLGDHHLKGMEWLEHLFQACAPGLEDNFPTLATMAAHPHNLPLERTTFIGREKETAALARLLEKNRLVTLTGPGGTGKTRLSLHVAAEVLERYPKGAWLVELAPLADPTLVPYSTAQALGLPDMPDKPIEQILVDFLKEKRLLLILDNCEHLLEACSTLVDRMLSACPFLTILASSREILGVEGEIPFRVPPLSMPDPRRLPPLDQLKEYDAVCLFVERAGVASPGFTLNEGNAGEIAQIVHRLDGIPLAIELATARLKLLGVEQLFERLNDTFRLLTGGSRSVLPRHQTLRACIDWSYNLLSDLERVLLRRLSVFAGGWSLQAAEGVCAGDTIQEGDILDLLSELLDKSLISAEAATSTRNRYYMLETVRQYAHEKLVDEGEAEAMRTRHLAFFVKFTEIMEPKIRSHEQIETLDRLELELDNLRLALEWGLQTDVQSELRLAVALKWLWSIRFRWSEGINWLERGLDVDVIQRTGRELAGEGALRRARALEVLGYHLVMGRSYFKKYSLTRCTKILEESVMLYRELLQAEGANVQRGLGYALLWLGNCHTYLGNIIDGQLGDLAQGQKLVDEALILLRQAGDPYGMAECMQFMCPFEPDVGLSGEIHEKQLAIVQKIGDIEGIASAMWSIGNHEYTNGKTEQAVISFEASLQCHQKAKNPQAIGLCLMKIGELCHRTGNLKRAHENYQQAMDLAKELGNVSLLQAVLLDQALLYIAGGLFDQAAELNDLSLAAAMQADDDVAIHTAHYLHARLARLRGDDERAIVLAHSVLEAGGEFVIPYMLARVEMGLLAISHGNLEQANDMWLKRIVIPYREGYGKWTGIPLDALGTLATQQGKAERAALLYGTRWSRGAYHLLSPNERLQRDKEFKQLREWLGEARFEQLYEQGREMALQQVIDLSLEGTGE